MSYMIWPYYGHILHCPLLSAVVQGDAVTWRGTALGGPHVSAAMQPSEDAEIL